MKSSILQFSLGLVAGAVIVAALAWFGRAEIFRSLSIGYQDIETPVELQTKVKLFQNGKQIGEIDQGAIVVLDGRAKDSPMEYFSFQLGWENRGLERGQVYKVFSKRGMSFTEMKPDTKIDRVGP